MATNKSKSEKQTKAKDPARGRTEVPGQNPRANDDPSHDEYNDENRRNMYDPEVGEALKISGKRSKGK